MTNVTLIYPYFKPSHDNSIFRFPPLGLGYIASYLQQENVKVNLVDCTFLSQEEALKIVRDSKPTIIGIYSMYSMRTQAMRMANLLRKDCEMLVAGGPLPTISPKEFLKDFDVVALGEGEQTMLELIHASERESNLKHVKGIVFKEKNGSGIIQTAPRPFLSNLDENPFPAREFFDNKAYKDYYSKRFGYTVTPIITSRGCPFNCEFCSRPVFGSNFRTRSATNVVDEIEAVLSMGYDRVWFNDDCFTLNRSRLVEICDKIVSRGLKVEWECLSRVDTIDFEVAQKMKKAGCVRVFFGIESGSDFTLALMNKQVTSDRAKNAVQIAKSAKIQTGAFFIVGYPGETDDTVLETIRFASSLHLDYLSFTLPYPIPGTPLYERVKPQLLSDDVKDDKRRLVDHTLLYHGSFSEFKLKFAIMKAAAQFRLRKNLGDSLYGFLCEPFEILTDGVFRILR